jgi:hypothetical protein
MAEENSGGTPPAGEQWYSKAEGVTPELIGHWQNKGWDATDPAKLALAASAAHRDAERLIGARSDHDLVAVPKDPTKGDMNAVWTRLGKPKEVAGYDLSKVTFKDGSQLEDSFVTSMRDTLFKANVPAAAAADIVKGVVDYMDGADASTAAETSAKVATEKSALAKNWGTTPERLAASPHMLVAQNAVRALGIDPATVNALEGQLGYAKVMDMFRNIGSKIGEDNFVPGVKPAGEGGALTVEQAHARKAELMSDASWAAKFLANDKDARREMTALDTIISAARAY